MAKITEIYQRFQNTPMLAEHQLRVAAVAKLICENLTVPADAGTVVTACLVHDLANILKFDFTVAPMFFEPQGPTYWRKVRDKIAAEYPDQDEHQATLSMAGRLGVSQKVLDCIDSIDFGKAVQTAAQTVMEPKICDYADLRVTPHGVVSLDERLAEGAKRYKDRKDKWLPEREYETIVKAVHENERQIFQKCRLKPDAITNEAIAPIVEQLRSYEI